MHQVEELYHALRPYILRRLKVDVEKTLPSKEEVIIEVELTRVQKKYYRAMYEKNLKMLNQQKFSTKTSLLNISMQLRKVCLHPYLLDGCEKVELENLSINHTIDDVMEKLVGASGKFVLLDKLLPKLRSEGHRVLIFSQFTSLLDILQNYFIFQLLDIFYLNK